ncbi:MAG: molybdenum cofactor biosynthesis protein MoaE [Chloroflexi bacterium]|nr:molybdenum cofactor biosynthesis protein MoaE [Chloroflexota bacterium]
MRVRVRCFASLRELAVDRGELQLPGAARVEDAWRALATQHPALEPHRPFTRPALNGVYAEWAAALADGDEVAFLPPVSGGATTGLVDGPIDVPALEGSVAGSGRGAIVTFVGRARDRSDDGREVMELEYEVYAELASAVLEEVAASAEARWGASVAVAHRHGVVPIGEAAVAIVTAAAHRGQAYEANRFVIEEIKSRLPIWKRERFRDGSEWKRPGA